MRKIILSITIVLISLSFLNAQSKEDLKYRKSSEELRQEVWAWDLPQFKVREVPQEYAKASKVVLAHHTELTAGSKSKFQFYVITFGIKKEQTITEVVREMIKLNDKSAINEYSELSFTQFEKSSGFLSSEKSTTYIGVRVIKPDGKIKEIIADDIVLTKDDKTEKKARLAIPDLQPGDILDYFIATDQLLVNFMEVKPYLFNLFDDAPILSLSFHGELGKKYTMDYRSYNGAPDFKVSKNKDKDIILDMEKKNIPPFETTLWVAPALQLPFIRMTISLARRGPGGRIVDNKKPGEVYKDNDAEIFLQHNLNDLSNNYFNHYLVGRSKIPFDQIVDEAKKKAKQSGVKYNDLSVEEKAAYLYYTMRYTKLINFDIESMAEKINSGSSRYKGFTFQLFCTLLSGGLEPAILISEEHAGIRFSELMDDDDLVTTTYLKGTNKFFHLASVFDIPFAAPARIEGVKNTKSISFNKKGNRLLDFGANVTISKSEENAHIENLKMSVVPSGNHLAVDRSSTLKGFFKLPAQTSLILYEDFYESERKQFNDTKTLIEQLESGKKSKKYVDEVKDAFADARKKQKESFEKEAADWMEQEVTDLKNYKIDNLGVRHTAPDFVYSSSFNMDGLVKKAGNNYIIEIGKIQGTPLAIKDNQRKRDIDIYMPYARSIEYNIELLIPEGYTAEGIEELNRSVKNEAGFFTVEASATAKSAIIKVKKHYLNNFEPAKNWDKIVAFTDASSEWVGAKLLLKKK